MQSIREKVYQQRNTNITKVKELLLDLFICRNIFKFNDIYIIYKVHLVSSNSKTPFDVSSSLRMQNSAFVLIASMARTTICNGIRAVSIVIL